MSREGHLTTAQKREMLKRKIPRDSILRFDTDILKLPDVKIDFARVSDWLCMAPQRTPVGADTLQDRLSQALSCYRKQTLSNENGREAIVKLGRFGLVIEKCRMEESPFAIAHFIASHLNYSYDSGKA